MSDQRPTFNRHARIRSRRLAVQALYQMSMSSSRIEDVIEEFILCRTGLKKADFDYFTKLLLGITKQSALLDKQLIPILDRKLEELDLIEKMILRIGLYELNFNMEIPYRVILNEAVELAKMFGAEQSHKYINGVLDKAARISRVAEICH